MSVNEYSIKTYLFYQDYKLFWGKNQKKQLFLKKSRSAQKPANRQKTEPKVGIMSLSPTVLVSKRRKI